MNKNVRFLSKDQAYRYMPNTSIENDVLDKVRYTIDNHQFAGNFYSSSWQGGGDGYLYDLDTYDEYLVGGRKLKEGEKIYRYFTRMSAISGSTPFIKINIDKGLLYYLKPDDEGLDLIEFETKGIPVRYLNIIPPEKEEYAEGGKTEKKVIEYAVRYERLVDGEYEPDRKYFDNKESAEKFAEEHHSYVEEVYEYAEGGRVGEPYDSMTKYQLEKELNKLTDEFYEIRKSYQTTEHPRQKKIDIERDKIITLLYGKNFSGVGQKYKYAEGGELKSYLSSRSDMFDENAKTIDKKDILEVISLSKNSDKKYWVKDLNTKYSYYIYKGNLRANDGTGGIFSTTILNPMWYYLKDEHRFKVQEEALYDWEKEKDPSIVKVGWDAIKEKFDNIFYMVEDGEDEIFANEVKLEESTYNWDGRPSPYKKRVSFSDAKSMFLQSLTDEEKAMIDLEYDYQDIHELFGLMSEKRFIVKRKKDESKDFLDELENINFEDSSLYLKNGGKLAWQSVEVGDNALVKSENKMGVVVVTYGRRFHLRFPDGSEKTYSAEDLEFLPSDSYANGGKIDDLVGRTITMYDMGVPEPKYYTISRVEMSPPYFSRKTLRVYNKYGNSELVDVIEDEQIDKFLNGEQVELRTSGGDYYAIKLMKEMKKGGTLEGGVKKNMIFDENGERRTDPEALAYIENTVEMLPQTKFEHSNAEGKYTAKRKKLHEEIISHFREDKPCVNKRPAVAILTGGAPASGKTTFIKKYVDLDPDKVYHVDADEVRAMLPEYKGWNATQTHLETADIVNRLIDEIGIPCEHDLIYDGTMNKATKYEKIVDKLHKLGYKVFVVYISIPEQVSKERVISRYKKAGRYVPMKVIEEVYDNGLTAFERVARELADGYVRIDGMTGEIIEKGGMEMPKNIEYAEGGEVEKSYLKNADSLVRSAERYAQATYEKPVNKGKGMARASKQNGQMKYTEVIVFFQDGEKITFDESEFPKFFMKDGGELGQDYYDGFQMQVITKKGNPDKEVQKQDTTFKYRKGGKL